MLVLERRVDESLVLRNVRTGEVIEVMLVESKHARAKIGIDAQKEWVVTRKEIRDERE